MNNTLPTMALVGLISGVAGAGLTSVLLPSPTQDLNPALGSQPQETDLSGVMARFDQLTNRLDEMEMELAQTAVRREVPQPAQVEMDDVMAQLRDYMAQLNNPAAAMPPNFESWVENATEAIRAREREEREVARAEREEARLEDQLSEMSEKLGLNNDQLSQMRSTLTEARTASSQLMADIREMGWGSDSREMMREGMAEIRESSKATLQGFLSPTQFETYQEEYGSNNFGMGRGGRGSDTRGGNRGGRGGI